MKLSKLGALVVLSTTLFGCASNGFYEGVSDETPKGIQEKVHKNFLGIPALASLEGSSVDIFDGWRATVAHNKPMLIGKEVVYHPTCDFALYKDVKSKETKLGTVSKNQEIFMTGYPTMGMFSSHVGEYLGDVTYDDCLYSASNGTVIGGMSGGGVFNDAGELVGLNVGVVNDTVVWPNGESAKNISLFISIEYVKSFIEETTKEKVVY